MKKLLSIAAMLIISITANAQVEIIKQTKNTVVGNVKPMGAFKASLEYTVMDSGDTLYFLTINDYQYKVTDVRKTISFTATQVELQSIYDAIVSATNAENKGEVVQFKVGKNMVSVKGSKNMGIQSAYIMIDGSAYIILTMKELKKLFGK